MGDIYFASNFNRNGTNTRSDFKNLNDKDLFDFLPDTNLMVAVKSIILDKHIQNEIFIKDENKLIPDIVIFFEKTLPPLDTADNNMDMYLTKFAPDGETLTMCSANLKVNYDIVLTNTEPFQLLCSRTQQEKYYALTFMMNKDKPTNSKKSGYVHLIYLKQESYPNSKILVEDINFSIKHIQRDTIDYLDYNETYGFFKNPNFNKEYRIYLSLIHI